MPATVELVPMFDPVLDRVGFPLDHPYVERVYASVLGPSSVLLLRRAAELFAEHPGGTKVDVVDLSRSLGLGVRADADDVGRNAPLRRTMDRLVHFRMAAWRGDDRLAVSPKVPAVERSRLGRLPESALSDHQRLLKDHLSGLVARAEGRQVEPTPTRSLAEAPTIESPVAARLREFGRPTPEPRIVAR